MPAFMERASARLKNIITWLAFSDPALISSVIICYSAHMGNTLKVARVIGEVLGAEIYKPGELDPREAVKKYQLIGLGSGIYYGRHHPSIITFAERLPEARDRYVFVFSTSGLPKIPVLHNYHKPLITILSRKGFRLVGEFSCRGYNLHGALRLIGGMNKGRPNAEDLERARRFAENILRRLA
jgi:flavodoxin